MLAAYAWDPFDRLQAFRSFTQDPDGVLAPEVDSHAVYRYDPLDRVRSQTESHDGAGEAGEKTSVFAYLALTSQVVTEEQTDTAGAAITTKAYRHDAFGRLVGMVNTPVDPERGGQAGVFTYGFDVHGSVSTLLDESGEVHAAYGYTPYGGVRDELSAGDDDPHDPLNPYRYTAKRVDTGTGSIDMGARRFGPDAARFLSRDRYLGALADLGLGFDPLTGNRYALAAGNPVSFVEVDGRTIIPNGGGGSATTTNPEPGLLDRLAASRGEQSHDAEVRFAHMYGTTPRDLYKREVAREPIRPLLDDLARLGEALPSPEEVHERLENCPLLAELSGVCVAGQAALYYAEGDAGGVARTAPWLLGGVGFGGAGRSAAGRVGRSLSDAPQTVVRAESAADAGRLARQLQLDEAASVFTRSGELHPSVIQGARPICRAVNSVIRRRSRR